MNSNRLYILCGLPFSGKSTLAKVIISKRNIIHLNVDDYVENRDSTGKVSDEEWSRIYDVCYKKLDEYLSLGLSVLFDATNYLKKIREKLRKIARINGVQSKVIYLDTPESIVRQRYLDNKKLT